MSNQIRILLIEDNPTDYLLFKEYINLSGIQEAEIINVVNLSSASNQASNKFDIIFLDLYLPDSKGLETFYKINSLFPHLPLIVLSGLEDSKTALETIKLGAQDYLIKEEFNDKILLKAINYSIERKRIQEKLAWSVESYELLARVTSEAVWNLTFATRKINYWNNGMKRLFGYEDAFVESGPEWWMDKIHEDDRAMVSEIMNSLLAEQREQFSAGYRFRCTDGQYKHVITRAIIIYQDQKPFRIIGSTQDIHELKLAETKLADEQLMHQRQVTEKTIEAQEQERAEIGRELHDNINQLLASSRVCLEAAMRNDEMREQMLTVGYNTLGTAISEIRNISKQLTPPTLGDIGLDEAIKELILPVATSHSMKIRQKIDEIEADPSLQLMIYRVIQEQVHNILKYSQASYVLITLKKKINKMVLTIIDNGVGFDIEQKSTGVGLFNIKSRAQAYGGLVKIISSPGNGCTIKMSIPLKKSGVFKLK